MPKMVLEEVTAAQRVQMETVLRRRDPSPRLRERLEMVKARALGQDLPTIARWSGRTVRTVERWLRRFAEGGAGALPWPMRHGPDARRAPIRPTARPSNAPWRRLRPPWGCPLMSGRARA